MDSWIDRTILHCSVDGKQNCWVTVRLSSCQPFTNEADVLPLVSNVKKLISCCIISLYNMVYYWSTNKVMHPHFLNPIFCLLGLKVTIMYIIDPPFIILALLRPGHSVVQTTGLTPVCVHSSCQWDAHVPFLSLSVDSFYVQSSLHALTSWTFRRAREGGRNCIRVVVCVCF